MEALSLGVPMVAVPQRADQPMNAKYVEDVWGWGCGRGRRRRWRAREALRTHDLPPPPRPPPPALYTTNKPFYDCYNIAFAPYSACWHRVRKLYILELLSARRVESYAPACAADREVNLRKVLGMYANGVLYRDAFGREFVEGGDYEKRGFESMLHEYQVLLRCFSLGDFIPSLEWLNVVTWLKRRLEKTFRRFNEFFDQILEDHTERGRRKEGEVDEEAKDLVDVMLDLQERRHLILHCAAAEKMKLSLFPPLSSSSPFSCLATLSPFMMNNSANKAVDTESTTCAQSSTKVGSKKSRSEIWDHFLKEKDEKTVARDCMKLYVCEKTCLKDKLAHLKSRIALTTDIWSSIQNLSYLVLTAHFVDDNWMLHKRLLNFVVMPSHKGKEIGKMVEKCIIDWGIRDCISYITVDNASSNDVAVVYLKDKLKNMLVLGGEFLHMRCATHILNLIVRDGLSEVRESISRIRVAVKYARSSPARAQQFQRCITDEGITYKGSICLDVTTRWNSTYLMLETALKFRSAFGRLEEDDIAFVNELDCGVPTSEDWDSASMLSLFLKNFYEATNMMSRSLYITCNHYWHEVVSMFSTLVECERDSNPCLRSMARKMREKFDKYYGSVERTNMMVLIAVVLDSRYKLRFLKYCCRRICYDADRVEEMTQNVTRVLERLFAFYEKSHSSSEQPSSVMDESDTQSHLQAIGGANAFVNPIKLVKDWYKDDIDEEELGLKYEMERYLSSRREPDSETFNVLKWWNDEKSTYKIFSSMAKDILAIPVSTVASESAFSIPGRVLDQFRSSFTPKFVEALICAQD
ncbi:zinc finger BED domain-containing protein RICESLEEPER 2-like [Canna indica]|uniref:Zinc finger BED domain-containing protein RICESLEEPER 2-like n=1 Tax=Canna indica TaxID=4628 RepID=A0AAQ3QCG2_9LILI|nr:zinc finger BED domain-containing protein RICESLEEPER 2-like [Canna indica]